MKNFFNLILLIILLGSISSGYVFYNQLNQERIELSSVGERIKSVKIDIEKTKKEISDLKKQNQSLQEMINSSSLQVDAYNLQISDLKNKNAEIFSKLHKKRLLLTKLKDGLDILTGERDKLLARLDIVTKKQHGIRQEISDLEKTKRGLENDIKEYIKPQNGISLRKIIVKLSQVPDGSILEVSKKFGFAIINIGTENGLIVGDVLNVYRNKELISKVIVEKVFQDAASVVPAAGFTNVELNKSDSVSLVR